MAENQAVWGIDIGQAGLKAIRLRYAEAAQQVLAVAFDYVPHPKILSQPDAVPDELIAQALQTFLSRNETRGDLIAISVPGQSALARFIQLPPVESSKVSEIVKYEARQQIPFALEDVIWDFQTLGSGSQEGGYLVDAEVGLFAMKKDQVAQYLRPYTEARCEIELIQIAPLALYNFLCYDRLNIRLNDEEDEESRPHHLVLDMGADNTMLLVSNGDKIWIRNVPIGGNHFTRALTKEMKLTFAKAEHLKINATKSPDPKAVFQALRPVFNDYVSEIQRSIGYFSSVNREAKIEKIIGVGNGFKLAGLQKFLHQNLQYDVERVESFEGVVGDAVTNVPLFQENIMSFVVPYGLALQGLNLTRIHTTLLPQEIKTARMIRRKKPWAVATAATLLVGLTTSALGYAHVHSTTEVSKWEPAEKAAKSAVDKATQLNSAYVAAETENKKLRETGEFLVRPAEGRDTWSEVYKVINECLPRDEGQAREEEDVTKLNRIRVFSINAKHYDDVGEWFKSQNAPQFMDEADKAAAPAGAGYVFTLHGVHYHFEKGDRNRQQLLYVVNTLLRNLKQWEFKNVGSDLPVPVRKMGISHPMILTSGVTMVEYYPNGRPSQTANPAAATGGFRPGIGAGAAPAVPARAKDEVVTERKAVQIQETNFVLAFIWKPIPPEERLAQPPSVEGAEGTPPADGTTPAPAPAPVAPDTTLADPALADPAVVPAP